MKTIVIPQKMSGTGTIHDVNNQHFERKIEFRGKTQFAVVLAAYYGDGNLYSTHITKEATIKASNRQKKCSHMIVDRDGEWYRCDGYKLQPVANY